MEAGANPPAETPTVPKAELDALKGRYDSLEKQHKSVQRELEKARSGSSMQRHLQERLDDVESLQLTTLEMFGKLGVEGLDPSKVIEERRAKKATAEKVNSEQERAGRQITSSARIGGITDEIFEDAWSSERFRESRRLWNESKYDEATAAFQVALTKPKEEPVRVYDDEAVKKLVEESAKTAVEKYVQSRTSVVDTTGGTRPPGPGNTDQLVKRLREINSLVENGRDVVDFQKELKDISLQLAGIK